MANEAAYREQRLSGSQITVDPAVRGGVPCVGNENWPIAHILEKLASGQTIETLIRENLDLTLADIQVALETAAWVMRDPAIDWSKLNLPEMVELQHELHAWQSLGDDILNSPDLPASDANPVL